MNRMLLCSAVCVGVMSLPTAALAEGETRIGLVLAIDGTGDDAVPKIVKIIDGSRAASRGDLDVDQYILKVNGVKTNRWTLNLAVKNMNGRSDGTVAFIVSPTKKLADGHQINLDVPPEVPIVPAVADTRTPEEKFYAECEGAMHDLEKQGYEMVLLDKSNGDSKTVWFDAKANSTYFIKVLTLENPGAFFPNGYYVTAQAYCQPGNGVEQDIDQKRSEHLGKSYIHQLQASAVFSSACNAAIQAQVHEHHGTKTCAAMYIAVGRKK